jgi:F1F0 ATPase subunit 2
MLGIFVGFALGLFFFGGLWATLRRLPTVRHPAVWALASFVLRLVGVAGGFITLTRFGLAGILGGLVGLLVARHIAIRQSRAPLLDRLQNRGAR